MSARVLFVCTANRCRSPLAEALARRAAAGRPVDFTSRGLIAGGEPTPDTGQRVAASLGLDLQNHLSVRLDPSELPDYDLVLTMTHEQARELIALDQNLWPRVFTVPEFARLATAHGGVPLTRLRAWLTTEMAERDRNELFRTNPEDEIMDPFGAPARVWRRVAARLESQIGQIVDALDDARPVTASTE